MTCDVRRVTSNESIDRVTFTASAASAASAAIAAFAACAASLLLVCFWWRVGLGFSVFRIQCRRCQWRGEWTSTTTYGPKSTGSKSIYSERQQQLPVVFMHWSREAFASQHACKLRADLSSCSHFRTSACFARACTFGANERLVHARLPHSRMLRLG